MSLPIILMNCLGPTKQLIDNNSHLFPLVAMGEFKEVKLLFDDIFECLNLW